MASTTGAVICMAGCSLAMRVRNADLSNDFSGAKVIAPVVVTLASTLSPSFSPAARVHSTGRRTAKLLPHFATCSLIAFLLYVYPWLYNIARRWACQHFISNPLPPSQEGD